MELQDVGGPGWPATTEASARQGRAPQSRPRERIPLGSFLPGSWHFKLQEERFMDL